jgi:coproporphyrinogen III oxidase-like Fe-S oxidoreductase
MHSRFSRIRFPASTGRFLVFPKAPGPGRAEALFTEASAVPGTYSVYVHVPFCKTLCSFCYYNVLPGRGVGEKVAYVDYLLREMAMYRDALRGLRCESVYVGGGTPTTLDDRQLGRLLEGLHSSFRLAPDAEVTIESAPDTLPREKVALLKSLGVNRLSYGIQTLDEGLLATMNRYYTVAGAIKELQAALPLIGNINVDTIYGFEDEPDEALFKTLTTFERLGIPCLTIYSLDTQRSVRKNVWLGPPRDALFYRKIAIYQEAKKLLESLGYEALFQNTFAKPGLGSYSHQLRRWENVSLVGLGIGAMGYAPRRPYQNYSTRSAYVSHLDAGELPIEATDTLSPEMEFGRQVATQIRFARLDLQAIQEKYDVDLRTVFDDLLRVLVDLDLLKRRADEVWLSNAAAPYNNVIAMLFSPDSFKEDLFGLPKDYVAAMPIPSVLTRAGATQSAPIVVRSPGAQLAMPNVPAATPGVYPGGSCPGLTR